MSSIFSETTLGGLSTFRKWLFRAAVGTIIFGVVLGVILIMTMSDAAFALPAILAVLGCICRGLWQNHRYDDLRRRHADLFVHLF